MRFSTELAKSNVLAPHCISCFDVNSVAWIIVEGLAVCRLSEVLSDVGKWLKLDET